MHDRTQPVDPTRLATGGWCHRSERRIDEGDISASYSADRIGTGQPVRKPFAWQGTRWVCTGRWQASECEAYRLVNPQAFPGTPTTYADKTRDGEAARSDPDGFYHGVMVRHGGKTLVLHGPPVTFVPGETSQLTLF